jgi:hypothetical protein
MKRVKILKDGKQIAGSEEYADPTQWIAKQVALNSWGLPERPELDEQNEPTGRMLPAEYEIVIEDITLQSEQRKINEEAMQYLTETDWMVIRAMDSGEPLPQEVKQARAQARARIVKL